MSSNTPNLGLLKKDPMVDGNETFNIETMLNENWDKVDEAVGKVREDLGNIDVDIPEASLTEKGIVQLSNATNGTRENVAATEKAVKVAYDRGSAGITAAAKAVPKAIPDNRSIASKPSDYSQNVAYTFKTGSIVGLPAEQFVVIHGFKGWTDDSGGVTHEYASGGTTGGMYHRTGSAANDTWGPWMQIIDYGAPWQKRKLTEDNGLSINVSNGNANNLTEAGLYVGENIANAPVTGAGQWYYINVMAMAAGVWVKQIAIDLFSNTYQMRTGSDAGGGVISWGPWTQDLFTSVANGKQAIATAISGKGVPASGSDEFAVLANKIGQISTGYQSLLNFSLGDINMKTQIMTRDLFTIPASKNFVNLFSVDHAYTTYKNFPVDCSTSIDSSFYFSSGSFMSARISLVDSAGLVCTIFDGRHWGHNGFVEFMRINVGISSLRLNRVTGDARACIWNGSGYHTISITLPPEFRTTEPIKVVGVHEHNFGESWTAFVCKDAANNINVVTL
ncbi:pyocin knob domain-containing protein [Paenibacillus lautus]|uniref:pyocin knob domain-containing protein n=1 Tax=Paenibacillus lautus TaxID=1401 RepID=UPI003D2B3939